MRPVSDEFIRTIRGSHVMSARARVCETFQTGTDPAGVEIPILDGDVVAETHGDIRATLDMVTDGNDRWPTAQGDTLLFPYGNEIFVERGVQYGNGVTEWCSLGYFRVETPEQDDAPHGPIRIFAQDRMSGIVDARLLAPAQFGASATYGSVVSQLVTEVYPAATIEWDGGFTGTLGRSLIAEEDRFGFLDDLVKALGKIWYWDHRGVLVIREQPTADDPVFDVNYGQDGVLVGLSRQLTRAGVYNAVVAHGEGTDTATPARGVAIDNNPLSRTYFYGPFGPVPRFYSSPFITTDAQAESAAASILRKQLGLVYAADFTAVPNPALEPYDSVRVRYSGRAGPEVHVLDRISIPLVAGAAMTATTREQSLVIVGTV